MFLQIGKRYTPFSALHQFFSTLPIICAQVAAKDFMQNTRWCPFNIKNNVQRLNTDIIHRLTQLSTQLNFRWTVPLI
jgi:hypothetical protein